MEKAFLSFQFREPQDPLYESERDLEMRVERLLSDHGLRPVTGRRLMGQMITPAVQRLIEESDCLVALLTPREALQGGDRFTTSEWVKAELQWAYTHDKQAIGILEEGVEIGGPLAAHEHISLDREHPLESLMDLSETIGMWRRTAGVARKVRLLPDDIGQDVRVDGRFTCQYRQRVGPKTFEWTKAEPVLEPGGTFIYLEGIRNNAAVEVEILDNGQRRWWSRSTPQFITVELLEA